MKKIIALLFISSWVINTWSNNRSISDSLRRYGIDSHIMKTYEFKKAHYSGKHTKNNKPKKKLRRCVSCFSN